MLKIKGHKGSLQDRTKQQSPKGGSFDESLSGAYVHRPRKVFPGYNLFDGRLMDMKGRVVKGWGARYLGLLLPNGCYIAQKHYKSLTWGLYSWNDEVIWEKEIPVHHDIHFTSRGTIITLMKEMHSYKGKNFDFCIVVEYDIKGRELMRWSTFENLYWLKQLQRPIVFDRSKMYFLSRQEGLKSRTPWGGQYDYFRINSFQLLPDTMLGRRDPRFREGNWLVSFRHDSMVAVIDKDTCRAVWTCIGVDLPDELQGQHGPTMLPNGRILIFDNGRWRGWSRVIEIDPQTQKIVWEYRAKGFFTMSQGYAQRFNNGNTLITESEQGRAFEITRDGEIVWEYYHPQAQDASNSAYPESYGKRQWIYRMQRYTTDFIEPFIGKKAE